MWKKRICIALSLAIILQAAVPAAVFAAPKENIQAEAVSAADRETGTEAAGRIWQPDIRLSIQKEKQLMQEAGMMLDEWDAEVEKCRQEAFQEPFTEALLLEAGPDTKILKEDGKIYYIGSCKAFTPIDGAVSAYRTAYRLVSLLGGSEKTILVLWSKLGINGQTVYSFQEIEGCEIVKGSTLKIALDENNEVTAVFANIGSDSDGENKEPVVRISRQDAEKEALEHSGTGEVCSEYTERTVLNPNDMGRALDAESEEEPLPGQPVWIVYTQNTAEDKETYPYLAQYVKPDGTWLKSLPVRQPGDEESLSGYRKQDIFTGMTAGEYTGEIRDLKGKTRTVTVPVMRNTQDGRWYLGDVGRRIAVADYYDAAYLEEHPIRLVGSDTNSGWDNEDLYLYYNYIRAWDFYADMGWIGPDGQKTDVVILKGLAYRSHKAYPNACSFERVENWQMFGYAPYEDNGMPIGLVQGLDVLAHEYTHTFTSSVMNQNLYQNDLGSINEAMSDIMGNLVEYICRDTEDTRWELGENTGHTIRCMSDPHSGTQPEYVWDLYYGPHVATPVTANDRGGVHGNSSLLNRIAALLCLEHGMSYEEAVCFWMTAAMGMTPKTDYIQMRALLEWAAVMSGNEKYLRALDAMITEERLDTYELPDKYPDGLKLVRMKLPATEAFEDDNWALIAFQMDTNSILNLGATLLGSLMTGEGISDLADALRELFSHIRLEGTELHVDETDVRSELARSILKQLMKKELVTQLFSWEADGTNEILVVARKDQPTLYLLMNITAGGSKINGCAVMIGGHWYDMQNFSDADRQQMTASLMMLTTGFFGYKDASGEEQTEYLTNDGLQNLKLQEFTQLQMP